MLTILKPALDSLLHNGFRKQLVILTHLCKAFSQNSQKIANQDMFITHSIFIIE